MTSDPVVTRLVEFDGPGRMVDAVGALLERPELDLVVVRGLLRPRAIRRLHPGDPGRREVLWAAVPRLREVTGLLAEWWSEHGYRDYRFVPPGFAPGNHRRGGLVAHLDPAEEDAYLYGPVTMSVVSSREGGTYLAERTSAVLCDEDRVFDPAAFEELERAVSSPSSTARRLRTEVEQRRGDAVLIMNHPTPTLHAVEAEHGREAHIFECLVEPVGVEA